MVFVETFSAGSPEELSSFFTKIPLRGVYIAELTYMNLYVVRKLAAFRRLMLCVM